MDIVKKSAIKLVLDLLTAKPEGESRLLAILVNKLGDNVKYVRSNLVIWIQYSCVSMCTRIDEE